MAEQLPKVLSPEDSVLERDALLSVALDLVNVIINPDVIH